jgi:hypothetical protein
MIDYKVYINGNLLDMFEDETVKITDSIKDAKDVGAIFTEYSKQLTVPASKNNNAIFKNFYNYDILNGFDARVKQPAEIKLNGETWKKGFIELMGVQMHMEQPKHYKIVFRGELSKLKDIIGDDKLNDLTSLAQFNHAYSFENAKKGFRNYLKINPDGSISEAFIPVNGDVCYPFITHSKRYTYETNNLFEVDTENNNVTNNLLEYQQLKPAIRLGRINEAIEDKYGIEFESNFFNSFNFRGLYMWLHRDEGFLSSDTFVNINLYRDDFLFTDEGTPSSENFWNDQGFFITEFNTNNETKIELKYDFIFDGSGEVTFQVVNQVNDNILMSETQNVDNETILKTINLSSDFNSVDFYQPVVKIETQDSGINTVDVELFAQSITTFTEMGVPSDVKTAFYDIEGGARVAINNLNILEQIPDMKVIDYLTSIFKMFNLVAFITDDDKIKIEELDDFYDLGNTHDLTDFVDINKKTIDKLHPFSDIELGFPDPSTFLTITRNRRLNRKFGFLSYDVSSESSANNELYSGGTYEVQPKFEKMLYERLKNITSNQWTPYVYGRFVDKKEDPTLGKPLIFFPIQTNTAGYDYFFDGETAQDVEDVYIRPSNAFSIFNTINFGAEIDEFTLNQNSNSLFENHYKNYVERVYNTQSRKINIEAVLPMWFIRQYELNDEIIINGRRFRINKIDIKLNDRRAKMELINIPQQPLPTQTDSESVNSTPLGRPQIQSENITSSSIKISWTPAHEFDERIDSYDVYIRNGTFETNVLKTEPLEFELTGLTSGTTIDFEIISRFNAEESGTRVGENKREYTTL